MSADFVKWPPYRITPAGASALGNPFSEQKKADKSDQSAICVVRQAQKRLNYRRKYKK